MNYFDTLDQLIRQGRAAEAKSQIFAHLPSLLRSQMARLDRVRLASLCKRVGATLAGLQLLHPLVRPSARSRIEATPSEKVEYAALLLQVGAGAEAQHLLNEVDPQEVPQAWLVGAHASFSTWDYLQAITPLKRYVGHPSLTDYQRLIGQVNLGAALVDAQLYSEADPIIADLLNKTERNGYNLLHVNSLEISAQSRIYSKRWSEAAQFLAKAKSMSKNMDTLDSFFIEKWESIYFLRKSDGCRNSRENLARIRMKARTRRNWETVRECDFHLAIVSGDPSLFRKVYFGTPFIAYQERLLREAPLGTASCDGAFEWISDEKPARREMPMILDLLNPESKGFALKPAQIQHRLLSALASDFYRPHTLASLHAKVFPHRFFSPTTSPQVMYQAVKRLRSWLDEAAFPIRVIEQDGNYSIALDRAGGIRVYSQQRKIPFKSQSLIKRLSDMRTEVPMTALQAAALWRVSKKTSTRALRELQEQGLVKRHGSGPNTRYELTSVASRESPQSSP